MMTKTRLSNHNWEQISTCLNGPHLWKCKLCGEWTRLYTRPEPDVQLIDPDNGEEYEAKPCNTF